MTDARALLVDRIDESIAAKRQLREDRQALDAVVTLAGWLADAYRAGGKLIALGNGGSAADAQHLAAELVGRFTLERRALPALALGQNPSALTAVSNDYTYADAFAREVEAFAAPGDVVLGISTSGGSANVVAALRRAAAVSARTVALVGSRPGPVGAAAELVISVPSERTATIQECHILIAHAVCELVEGALFAGAATGAPAAQA